MEHDVHAVPGSVIWLDEIGAGDANAVGSKAAVLGALRARHFEVPDGFVVTAAAYRCAVDAAGVGSILDYPVGLCPDARAEARFRTTLVAQVAVPPTVVGAIADAYAKLAARSGCADPVVAVRESVVGEEATFGPTAPALTGIAGLAGLVDAVERCWTALFNEQAMVTRAALGQGAGPAMAVIVQQLVDTARSGTAYTVDPVLRRDDFVRIMAAPSDRGDAPRRYPPRYPLADTYVVSRHGQELVELHVPERASDGAHYQRVLRDEEASLVAATALEVEAVVGGPAAVDWALAANGRVVVLKAEPIPHGKDQGPAA